MVGKLQFLPLIVFVVFPCTFIITYLMAVSHGHIRPFYAYISDTGTVSPESCIFGLLLNIIAVLLGSVMYVRFKQVEEYLKTRNASSTMKIVNIISALFGLASCIGVSVVGCFQETNILSVHIVGAFLAFEIGAIYLIFQAYFTFKMLPLFASKGIAYLRLFIGISCAILFIVTFTAAVFSVNAFKGEKHEFLKWEPHHGGWTLHVISVVSEWIMAALFDIYLITFMIDFRKIRIQGPKCEVPEDGTGLRDCAKEKSRNEKGGQSQRFIPPTQL